jgi:hypothetical protein
VEVRWLLSGNDEGRPTGVVVPAEAGREQTVELGLHAPDRITLLGEHGNTGTTVHLQAQVAAQPPSGQIIRTV